MEKVGERHDGCVHFRGRQARRQDVGRVGGSARRCGRRSRDVRVLRQEIERVAAVGRTLLVLSSAAQARQYVQI